MQIHNIKRKTANKKSAQVGRGGKRGKTSGKGTKGQNARSGRKKRPEMRDIIKRLPKLRGRGKNSNLTIQVKPEPVNLSRINEVFAQGETVSPMTLVAKGVLSLRKGNYPKVKVLGGGEISKAVTIESCLVSEEAREKIVAAGGSVR